MSVLLSILDLSGTFVFGLSGAIAGVRHKADLFGILVLSFAAASAGGIIRDLLMGSVPPAAISQWQYIVAALLPGFVTFYMYPLLKRLNSPVLVFDAMGLSLFAVSGSIKAMEFHLNPLAAVFLGVLTAVGGGMARDVLVREIPAVLRTDIYAVAAVAGSTAVVLWVYAGLPTVAGAIIGGTLCFSIRIMSIRLHWKLPVAPNSD